LINLGLMGLLISGNKGPIPIEPLLFWFAVIDIFVTTGLLVLIIVVAVRRRSQVGLVSVCVALLAMICLTVFNMRYASLALFAGGC
jgi:hypothetical protein